MSTDRTPAPPLSPDEEHAVARFDAAPDLPESYACTCGHEGLAAQWHADGCGKPCTCPAEWPIHRASCSGEGQVDDDAETVERVAQVIAARAGWHGVVIRGAQARDIAAAALSAVHDRDGQR